MLALIEVETEYVEGLPPVATLFPLVDAVPESSDADTDNDFVTPEPLKLFTA